MSELTPKQQRFVEEYLIDLNATQAAIRTGYSEKTAKEQASRLLTNANISRAIEEAVKSRSERTEITQDYVLTGLKEVAERCLQRKRVMVFDHVEKCMVQAEDEETWQGIWTFDSTGANRAFELLGKHLKLFTDKTEHSGTVAVVFSGEDHLQDEQG
jgi:phage terminase small subunit